MSRNFLKGFLILSFVGSVALGGCRYQKSVDTQSAPTPSPIQLSFSGAAVLGCGPGLEGETIYSGSYASSNDPTTQNWKPIVRGAGPYDSAEKVLEELNKYAQQDGLGEFTLGYFPENCR